jgi:hypothetical protein
MSIGDDFKSLLDDVMAAAVHVHLDRPAQAQRALRQVNKKLAVLMVYVDALAGPSKLPKIKRGK